MHGHAHLVAGTAELIPKILEMFERDASDPDVYVRGYRNFGIDDARALRARASLRSFSKNGRLFIIAATSMTSEAQNALLKTLEEPPMGAQFVIVVPAPQTLLATLQSRAQHLRIKGGREASALAIDPAQFLKSPPAARVDMLKPLLDRDENDERDIGAAVQFLAALERALEKTTGTPEGRTGLHAILRARKYSTDKGVLLKPLLEHVAFLVPRV